MVQKMKKQMRRRRADSSSSDEGEGEHGPAATGDLGVQKKSLAELREEQRQRKLKLGVQAASTLEGVVDDGSKKKGKAAAAAEEEDEEEQEKQKSIGEMMESNFTGMRYVRKEDESTPHERIMQQYIDEKLGVKRKEEPQEQLPPAKLSRRDKLLQITEEIHAKARGPESQKKGGGDDESGVGEGAPIAYSTGIAEVALPIEFKMRNIEETERARLRHEHGGGGQREEVVGNLTTNYHHYRREHAIEMRAKEGRPTGAFRRPDGEGPKGRAAMTDDIIYDRFKKRGGGRR